MRVRNYLKILLALVLAFSIAGCKRSASKAPTGTGENTEESNLTFPIPGSTQDPMKMLEMIATQTAMALSRDIGTPIGVSPTETGTNAIETSVSGGNPTHGGTPVVITTPVPTLAAPLPGGVPDKYAIHSGEFIYCIARRFNVDPTDLMSVNGLSTESYLNPGDELVIPKGARSYPGERALRPHPTTYTVTQGATIYSIACLFGDVDPLAIAQVNGLGKPYSLSGGQVLQIP